MLDADLKSRPKVKEKEGYSNPYELKIFSGTANRELSNEIARYLGVELGKLKVNKFKDGEFYVQIGESVRGKDIYIIQPTCKPSNENLMELMILTDAFKRASCHEITVVIPYFGYARQDRKTQGREAITSKLVADLIQTAGADRVITVELHAGQIQGFFNIPVDNLYSTPVILDYIKSKNLSDIIIVSPDVGGVARARAFAKKLDAPIAIIDKRRPEHNKAEVMHLIGDVKGKTAILFDDMIDTAGTICAGAKSLKENGAKDIYAVGTHAVLSDNAVERLNDAPIKEVIITNSIPFSDKREKYNTDKFVVLSLAKLLGDAINCIDKKGSMSSLFD
ncbi:MAG: ribose-phosphate pyrophosphokinase [Candidatus Sericytochromatia bacterium]